VNIKKYIQSANTWKDLNKILESFTKSNRSKLAGDIFEYLTKLYLQTAPEYKSKLKKVFLEKEVPSNLRKKLNLPDTDEGIDLIAVTNDDDYWAIQCKYRSDPSDTLTLRNLSTFNFTAFTHCKNISHGIVCATVNKPPKKKKLSKFLGYELLETWLGLDDGDLFQQIKAKCVGKKYKPIILKPRPHQVTAIKKTIDHFKSNERGKIIMPCGTGKSLTAFWIAKKMGVKSILVAVPSLALLQQTLKVWTREFLINGIEPEWFCVCSDGTVKDDQDDYVTDTSDLGIKVDTDPKLIKQFLKKKTSKIKVLFTTYQSGRATSKGSRGFTYDLGIMDEAHKTVGSKTKEMAHLLHQKNVKIKKRISMTATERLFRGDSDEFMSMDDPRDYGDLIYELSFKEAINSKPSIISDYKIITFGITVPEIEEIYNSNKYLEVKKVLKDITARELATALALRKAIKKFKINNAISFHRSIRRADNFRTQQDLITKIYPEYGKLKSFHVRGDMPTSERATQMREFAKGKGLMTNARCLTEGVDLPAIDCVCFTDPKRSKVDIVQAAGRALRLSKGKKFGYILIPIFIPAGADFNEAAEEQGFDDVAITVRALAASDTRISEYLRVIAEGKKPRGGSPVEGLTSANSLYKIEAKEFDKAIKLKVWDKVAIGNYRTYEEARKYSLKNKIENFKQWMELTNDKNFPKDIPSKPHNVYKNKGWTSYGEFFGTGRVANQKRKFLDFIDARKYVRKLKIKNQTEWLKYAKSKDRKEEIPYQPWRTYKNKGWKNLGDWLGTGRIADREKNYLSFKKAKNYAKSLNLESSTEWFLLHRKGKIKKNIPIFCNQTYKNKGWKGWSDFLGTRYKSFRFNSSLDFNSAKKYARSLDIKSSKEWRTLYDEGKININIPKYVNEHYKNKGWNGWSDFLGYEKYLNFSDAKKKLRILKVTSRSIYQVSYKKGILKNLPSDPFYYNKFPQWKNLPDFLSSKNLPKNIEYLSLEDHYVFAKKHDVKNINDWRKICKSKPPNIHSMPEKKFKNKGWVSYSHFFGNKHITNRDKIFPFVKANKLIKKFNIKSKSDYTIKYRKGILSGFPSSPDYYNNRKNWKGTGSFLGTNTIAPQNIKFKNFSEHKKFAKKLKLRNSIEWENFCKSGKKPFDIYVAVKYKFKNQWKGWTDFLGKKK